MEVGSISSTQIHYELVFTHALSRYASPYKNIRESDAQGPPGFLQFSRAFSIFVVMQL